MTRQNRVFPDGTIRADPARGMFMGNRGCLHDETGQIRRNWQVRRWITCLTAFKGRRRQILRPGHYTELFFMDEAVAAAAGHRPCAECRRADHIAFRAAWVAAHGPVSGVDQIDHALHAARLGDRVTMAARDLPDGAMVVWMGQPHLVLGDSLRAWTPAGYGPPLPQPGGKLPLLTPKPLIDPLHAGWSIRLHATAGPNHLV